MLFASCIAIVVLSFSAGVSAVTTLNNGSSLASGQIGYITWQASGVMTEGCADTIADISDNCFAMSLSSNPNDNLDPTTGSPRQRNELHFPKMTDGTTWTYYWKYYLASGTGSTDHFFHLMQVFADTTDGGPVITLDAVNGVVQIEDDYRGCQPCGGSTMALSSFEGRALGHSIVITTGSTGSLSYEVKDPGNGDVLLSYSVTGDMGSDVYIKTGTYRDVEGITTGVTAYVGDFSYTQD